MAIDTTSLQGNSDEQRFWDLHPVREAGHAPPPGRYYGCGDKGIAALVSLGCLLVLVPGAGAATLAPNAGFEANCSGSPCNWASIGGTFVWDNTAVHTGSASARLTGPGTASAFRSDCITLATSGLYTNTFFYRALISRLLRRRRSRHSLHSRQWSRRNRRPLAHRL